MELIIHAFLSSRLEYCDGLFSCLNNKELSRLQLVQNSAARILILILVLTFRALHGQVPPYISDLIQPYILPRALRSVDQNLLMVPRTRFRTRGDRSLQAVAPRLWNDLSLSLRLMEPVDSFKIQDSRFKKTLFIPREIVLQQ